jgi:putative spermidine/putrescine transport system substrate-binding protein
VNKRTAISRRRFLHMSAIAAAMAGFGPRLALAQDATATPLPELPPAPTPGPIDLEAAGGLEELIEAARAEGALSTTALPDDWANYGKMKQVFFQEKYDFLEHTDITPEASSAEEIEQIRANAGNSGPQNPDVIDVGFVWGDQAKEQGLLQPYKVEGWDTIPAEIKDADGYWYGNYYGTMAFEVNVDAVPFVPEDWNDLLDPRLKGLIAFNDPVAGSQNTHAVWAATFAEGGNSSASWPKVATLCLPLGLRRRSSAANSPSPCAGITTRWRTAITTPIRQIFRLFIQRVAQLPAYTCAQSTPMRLVRMLLACGWNLSTAMKVS